MSFCNLIFFLTALAASFAGAQTTAPKAPTVTSPSVTKPTVSPPAVPAPVAPQTAAPQATPPTSTPAPRSLLPAAPLIATKFEDGAYKQQIDASTTVLLIFSETNDPVWTKQAPVLQSILKEAEFGRIAVFQIDTGNSPTVADRFLVKIPGTMVIMKGGVERLRSTRMTKPDVIRKMLRLHTAL
ncbi:MAG: hypothetical protein J0L82_02615 [Deltaproteobacteria bacterium]|nr:hypothetical protein [Deltaproteobacteria bacterium]